jgi:2-polyprenyl-6-methoxyphenol hydroxylase-like FAD-dependent oxidoreductase
MPELKELGAGLVLAMNAMAAMREIGMADRIAAEGNPLHDFGHRTSEGELITSWPLAPLERRLGEVGYSMPRPALQRVLREAVGEADVEVGAEVVGFEDDESGVVVRLADGREKRGGVLIGADGLHSTLRPMFDPTPLAYAGFTAWRGLARPPRDLGIPDGRQVQTYGEGAVFGTIPLGGNRFYWYATENAPSGGEDEPGRRKAALLERFAAWHDPIAEVIESTDEEQIARTDVYDLPKRDAWGSGRVTFLGDAAHPTTPTLGQGACLAIEDAVVLGRHLGAAGRDPVAALRAYEAERIPRTAWVVAQSGARAKLVQVTGRFPVWRRNTILRALPQPLVYRRLTKVFGFPRPGESG